jgi:hypothetical protein
VFRKQLSSNSLQRQKQLLIEEAKLKWNEAYRKELSRQVTTLFMNDLSQRKRKLLKVIVFILNF